jgi:ketosteroid isomerase-like protein
MSENLDLVRSIYADWERGDFRQTAEWAHPEFEYVQVGGPHPGTWIEGFRSLLGAWTDFQSTAESYRELDAERVLTFAHAGGRGKASGVEIPMAQTRHAALFHIREGKVIRLVLYFDPNRALADLGLEE